MAVYDFIESMVRMQFPVILIKGQRVEYIHSPKSKVSFIILVIFSWASRLSDPKI